MLTDDQISAIRSSIRRSNPKTTTLVKVEQGGDEAFDYIRGMMDKEALPPDHQVNALRRLSLLTRHACFYRKDEVLEQALRLLEDESVVVRSGAAKMVIGTVQILERYPQRIRSERYKPGATPSLRELVEAALQATLVRGLDDEQAELVRSFLSGATSNDLPGATSNDST